MGQNKKFGKEGADSLAGPRKKYGGKGKGSHRRKGG